MSFMQQQQTANTFSGVSQTRSTLPVPTVRSTVPPSPTRTKIPVPTLSVPPSPTKSKLPTPPSPTRKLPPVKAPQLSGSSLLQTKRGSNKNGYQLPSKPETEIMNQEFEIRDYQGIVSKASIENELINAGYAPLSKIVIQGEGGEKRTEYIKAVNMMGQKVFIYIDANGYTTVKANDLTLISPQNASVVPYSIKTGAYNCAGKDVCGVAFECGSDAVCVLARAPNDLTPKESNFVFEEKSGETAVFEEGSIMTYPVVRLSEIRANPNLVLQNSDTVTRRLRNTVYTSLLQELATTQKSIEKLNESFLMFDKMRADAATKLNTTLTQLEQWNAVYMSNPPNSDEAKDRYRMLQFNLSLRNENIALLLRSMMKVSELTSGINSITKQITDIIEVGDKEFANIDQAVSE